jgi:hypothetical protein
LGVAEEVAELAIGHARAGLVGTYNKDEAWKSRVDAFERVSEHIAKIVMGSATIAENKEIVALAGWR